MMNDQPQRPLSDAGDDCDDGVLRQLLTQYPTDDSPAEIEAQVLARVSRRRRTLRAVRTGIGAAAALAVVILSQRFMTTDSPRTQVAHSERPGSKSAIETIPMSIVNAELVSLSATSPVVHFPLLHQDQLAILHCLRSLEEEEL